MYGCSTLEDTCSYIGTQLLILGPLTSMTVCVNIIQCNLMSIELFLDFFLLKIMLLKLKSIG